MIRKTALIYMASGFGRRFGANKLLVSFRGKPLYRYGLESLLEAARILTVRDGLQAQVVVVSHYGEILEYATLRGAVTVYNGESREGIAASVRLGTMAAAAGTDLYLFSVADQPYMRAETLAALVREGLERSRKIGCLSCCGKRGNPAVFGSIYREELLALRGDRGGSAIMNRYPEDLWTLEVSEDEMRDMDVREDMNG